MSFGSHTYPADVPTHQGLSRDLTAIPSEPTQTLRRFQKSKIQSMLREMLLNQFNWQVAAKQPVILSPQGEVLDGHHRLVAAHLAGIDLLKMQGQVMRMPNRVRPAYDWASVLPV